jgi:hypothetical protein
MKEGEAELGRAKELSQQSDYDQTNESTHCRGMSRKEKCLTGLILVFKRVEELKHFIISGWSGNKLSTAWSQSSKYGCESLMSPSLEMQTCWFGTYKKNHIRF